MPLLESNDLIRQYYETIKDKYGLTFDQVERICKAPFWYIKEQMETGILPLILVKYLGKFRVHPTTIYRLINLNNDRLKRETITPKQHLERETRYNEILNQLQNDDYTGIEEDT